MLEKPELDDEKIVACLRDAYGLKIAEVTFLPLGADINTAVYRVVTEDQTLYFLKLRSGVFDETSVLLPRFLHDQGIRQIIAPLATIGGRFWADLDAFKVILSPFIEGRGGFEVDLSDSQWIEFGAALKAVHSAVPPAEIRDRLERETYAPKWREIVRAFQARVEGETFADPISAKLAALLNDNRLLILDLLARAERLSAALEVRAQDAEKWVVCHADIHVGNILLEPSGAIYLVDWDNPILAPKERDLMFVGGGVGGGAHTPEEEEALFYQGYGQTEIDAVALAYYRYERIVQDIAAYCEEILVMDRGDDDREVGLRQLTSQFRPNQVIDIAYRSDKTLRSD